MAIAAALRDRYGVNARVAMRVARGWSQAEAALAWNRRWPDEPKTFKNFSYWENWPSPTGYAPSLAVLDRLAELYECDVADLLAGWGEHRRGSVSAAEGQTEQAVLGWQVENLAPPDLTRAVDEWSRRLSPVDRRSLLLKLSMAAAEAANDPEPPSAGAVVGAAPTLDELVGMWDSSYTFYSTGRGTEFSHSHRIALRAERGRLIGRSLQTPVGRAMNG